MKHTKKIAKEVEEALIKDTTLSISDKVNVEITKKKSMEVLDPDFCPPSVKIEQELDDNLFEEDKEIFNPDEIPNQPDQDESRRRGMIFMKNNLVRILT